ncbi:MAG: haloacid dehalogenase [Hyphomicrobiales bacterium]|nr:MAG: haloacid dehalogenase [Hyphomicrobiales bacterium]
MPTNVSRPAALLFDVDGTIAETEDAHRRAFNQAFADFNIDIVWDQKMYRSLLAVAGGKERIRHYLSKHEPERIAAISPQVDDLHAVKTRHFRDLAAAGAIALRPGVMRLMAEARTHGIPIAIATTMTRPSLEALFTPILGPGALDRFSAIATGDRVEAKKPAPDIYLLALSTLGLAATDCVALEDSHIGVTAARSAGLPVIATPSLYTDHDDFSAATTVLSDLGEPGAPCRHIAGKAFPGDIVTVDALTAWMGA